VALLIITCAGRGGDRALQWLHHLDMDYPINVIIYSLRYGQLTERLQPDNINKLPVMSPVTSDNGTNEVWLIRLPGCPGTTGSLTTWL